jgi:hypothetical protein
VAAAGLGAHRALESEREGLAVTPAVAMSEAELLAGLTEALELCGWTWTHIRRSDGVTMGDSGLPDIIACNGPTPIVLAWELKSAFGQPSAEQLSWLLGFRVEGVDVRIIRPTDYDAALKVITGALHPRQAFA